MTVETKTEGASDFDALVAEIGDLHKAMKDDGDTAKDDAKIEDAAEEDADEDKDEDKENVSKSFKFTLPDGTEVDALDGTELIKSLTLRLEKNEATFGGAMRQMLDIVKSQGAEITKLRSAGKGRKAVVTVAEKKPVEADVAKSEADTMPAGEFMAKSMQAFTAGKISGHDVRLAETAINQGKPVPERIVRAVMAS